MGDGPTEALLQIPSRSFGEHEVALYGELSQDHNPIHSDKEFAANTPFGEPIVYGLLIVMPVWAALENAFGRQAVDLCMATVRFIKPLIVGKTAHYTATVDRAGDVCDVQFTISAEGTGPIAIVTAQLTRSSQAGL